MSEVAIDDDATAGRSRVASNLRLLRLLMIGWSIVVVVVLGIGWVNVSTSEVSGPSMEPTLESGDTIVVARRALPDVGDVVTADLGPDPDDRHGVVKRVVAIGGDVVEYSDCRLVRNGELVDEPYLGDWSRSGFCGQTLAATTVPPGHVWLMGDNRIESIDSREYGPVPLAQVDGVMILTF